MNYTYSNNPGWTTTTTEVQNTSADNAASLPPPWVQPLVVPDNAETGYCNSKDGVKHEEGGYPMSYVSSMASHPTTTQPSRVKGCSRGGCGRCNEHDVISTSSSRSFYDQPIGATETVSATPGSLTNGRKSNNPVSEGGSSEQSANTSQSTETRTGPTSWPPHIQAKRPEFSSCAPSPLMLYYYDETAPNDILLANDVCGSVSPTAKAAWTKCITCQAGRYHDYPVDGDYYSEKLSTLIKSPPASQLLESDESSSVAWDKAPDSSVIEGSSTAANKRAQRCCGPRRFTSGPSSLSSSYRSGSSYSSATASVADEQQAILQSQYNNSVHGNPSAPTHPSLSEAHYAVVAPRCNNGVGLKPDEDRRISVGGIAKFSTLNAVPNTYVTTEGQMGNIQKIASVNRGGVQPYVIPTYTAGSPQYSSWNPNSQKAPSNQPIAVIGKPKPTKYNARICGGAGHRDATNEEDRMSSYSSSTCSSESNRSSVLERKITPNGTVIIRRRCDKCNGKGYIETRLPAGDKKKRICQCYDAHSVASHQERPAQAIVKPPSRTASPADLPPSHKPSATPLTVQQRAISQEPRAQQKKHTNNCCSTRAHTPERLSTLPEGTDSDIFEEARPTQTLSVSTITHKSRVTPIKASDAGSKKKSERVCCGSLRRKHDQNVPNDDDMTEVDYEGTEAPQEREPSVKTTSFQSVKPPTQISQPALRAVQPDEKHQTTCCGRGRQHTYTTATVDTGSVYQSYTASIVDDGATYPSEVYSIPRKETVEREDSVKRVAERGISETVPPSVVVEQHHPRTDSRKSRRACCGPPSVVSSAVEFRTSSQPRSISIQARNVTGSHVPPESQSLQKSPSWTEVASQPTKKTQSYERPKTKKSNRRCCEPRDDNSVYTEMDQADQEDFEKSTYSEVGAYPPTKGSHYTEAREVDMKSASEPRMTSVKSKKSSNLQDRQLTAEEIEELEELEQEEEIDTLKELSRKAEEEIQPPSNKPEREKDFGYNIRKMFFNAEDEEALEKAAGEMDDFIMCPSYSVSYKNYPNVCYDVVVPRNYGDFFRVRCQPL